MIDLNSMTFMTKGPCFTYLNAKNVSIGRVFMTTSNKNAKLSISARILCLKRLKRTLGELKVNRAVYRAIWDRTGHMGHNWTKQDHMGTYETIQDHTGP